MILNKIKLNYNYYHSNENKQVRMLQGEHKRLDCSIKIRMYVTFEKKIQSTRVISKSKGPTETLRDICTLTYQICRIEKNTN